MPELRVGVLGPFEVRLDEQPVGPGGPKRRGLLAMLAIRANRMVRVDELVDGLWGDAPPSSATNVVQTYVSAWRKVLHPCPGDGDRLLTMGPGYRLGLAEAELDLAQFTGLAERATAAGPRQAADLWRQALALWRGAPLADLRGEPFQPAAATRLAEMRLAAVEGWVAAELELGRAERVVAELAEVRREEPLRERLTELYLWALFQTGRQAEALTAFEQTRRLLADELGADPGPGLRDMHARVLRHDSSLMAPTAPAPLARTRSPDSTQYPHATSPGAGPVRKTVTALFCDAVGSTELSDQLDAEVLQRMMSRYFDAVRRVLERHGGTVEKFIGDAVMAVFGVPTAREDDTLRAVRAAHDIRQALGQLNADLQLEHGLQLAVRVGIDTGPVLVGAPEHGALATGMTINMAARLEQGAAPGEVLLGEGAWRLVRDQVDLEPVEPLAVKGRPERQPAWRLLPPGPPRPPVWHAPFVGRKRELRLLADALDRCVEERICQLFTVLGVAGAGKSRLLAEFVGGLAEQVSVARGRCRSYGEDIALWPLNEALRDAAGIDPADDDDTVRSKLAVPVAREPERHRIVELLAPLAGAGGVPASPEDIQWAVRRWLQARTASSPLVIVIEDLHWADPTLLMLVEQLAALVREAELLLVCTARPEFLEVRPDWGGGVLQATTLTLSGLGDADVAALLDRLPEGAALDPAGRAIVGHSASGNPLFLEQLLAMLTDDGTLRQTATGWEQSRPVRTAVMPPTISAVLTARLDLLQPAELSVAQAAAVIGEEFYAGAVDEILVDADSAMVSQLLIRLVRKELLRPSRSDLPGEDGYRFLHSLVRDAAYETAAKATRAGMHERLARWLDKRADALASMADELVGHHLERAYRLRRQLEPDGPTLRELGGSAARRLALAADRVQVLAPATAAELYRRAAALWPPEDPTALELCFRQSQALELQGRFAEAIAVLDELLGRSPERRIAALARLARVRMLRHVDPAMKLADLEEAADAAIVQFRDDPGVLAWAYEAKTDAANEQNRPAEPTLHLLRLAIGYARQVGETSLVNRLVMEYQFGLCFAEVPASAALAELDRTDELCDSLLLDAVRRGQRGWMHAMIDRPEQARAELAEMASLLAELGGGYASMYGGVCTYEAGAVLDDLELMGGIRAMTDRLRELGETSWLSTFSNCLGEWHYRRGELAAAAECAAESRGHAAVTDAASQAGWRSLEAKLAADRGDVVEAVRLAEEAVSWFAGRDKGPHGGRWHLDVAHVYTVAGRNRDARRHLCEAIATFDRKGDLPEARRARALFEPNAV